MDPFIRRLIERLHNPSKPLSRNRHFYTFNNPEGRYALKLSRRLKALQKEILQCQQQGVPAQFVRHRDVEGQYRIELQFQKIHGQRISLLEEDEFTLLLQMPGVRAA